MMRHRARIRFRKQQDLRWISHRDLIRAFERMLRRAALPLGMSEGFHPKPRINFPSALSVGIAADAEWVEIELAAAVEPDDVRQRLARTAPAGLVIDHVELVPEGRRKAQASFQSLEFPVPADRHAAVRAAVERFLSEPSLAITRPGDAGSIDLRAGVDHLELSDDGYLRMRLAIARQASVHPRDVLRWLALDDLERSGVCLTRTAVELAPCRQPPNNLQAHRSESYEEGNVDQRLSAGGMPDRGD